MKNLVGSLLFEIKGVDTQEVIAVKVIRNPINSKEQSS